MPVLECTNLIAILWIPALIFIAIIVVLLLDYFEKK